MVNKQNFKHIYNFTVAHSLTLYFTHNIILRMSAWYDINLCVSKYEIKCTKCIYDTNVISVNSIEYININYEELLVMYETRCRYVGR